MLAGRLIAVDKQSTHRTGVDRIADFGRSDVAHDAASLIATGTHCSGVVALGGHGTGFHFAHDAASRCEININRSKVGAVLDAAE